MSISRLSTSRIGNGMPKEKGISLLNEPLGNFYSIATATVDSGGASSITFSNIPPIFKHLQLRCTVITGALGWVQLRMNSDSGTNYSFHELRGDGTSASANPQASGVGYQAFLHNTSVGAGVIDILEYGSTVKNKVHKTLGGYDANGSGYMSATSGAWLNSSTACTTLTINSTTSTFSQYTQFALYGVK